MPKKKSKKKKRVTNKRASVETSNAQENLPTMTVALRAPSIEKNPRRPRIG